MGGTGRSNSTGLTDRYSSLRRGIDSSESSCGPGTTLHCVSSAPRACGTTTNPFSSIMDYEITGRAGSKKGIVDGMNCTLNHDTDAASLSACGLGPYLIV